MSQRDTGWIQLYCSSAQELLDSVLCAYRIAEEAMLPVLVCAEGFLLSHTAEVVDVPTPGGGGRVPAAVHGRRRTGCSTRTSRAPSAACRSRPSTRRSSAASLRRTTARADCSPRSPSDFERIFGREKVASVEFSGDPDADTAIVTIGTIGETARELLADDEPLLVARVHAYRPFPGDELAAALAARLPCLRHRPLRPRSAHDGPLGEDVRAYGIPATDVLCGLGGSDVTPDTLRLALERAQSLPGREAVYLGEAE